MATGAAGTLALWSSNQCLGELADRSCEQVARQVAGVQAQVPAAAGLAFRARSASVTARDVAAALYEERSLVRTWLMRGTVHLVTPGTLAVASAALAEHARERDLRLLAGLGYAESAVRRLWDLVTATLESARGPMTREEIADRIGARGDILRHSWGIALRPLATEGLICFGPVDGRKTTFVLTERWLGRLPAAGGDPVQQLALAYLRAYGPATVTDFAFWSGLPVHRARTAFASLESSLTSTDEGWSAPGGAAPRPAGTSASRTILLPAFDPYLLGRKDKTLIVERERYKDVFGKAGRIAPAILVDGRVVGTWGYKRRASRVDIECTSFGDAALPEAALGKAAEHLAGHWRLPVAVQVRHDSR